MKLQPRSGQGVLGKSHPLHAFWLAHASTHPLLWAPPLRHPTVLDREQCRPRAPLLLYEPRALLLQQRKALSQRGRGQGDYPSRLAVAAIASATATLPTAFAWPLPSLLLLPLLLLLLRLLLLSPLL